MINGPSMVMAPLCRPTVEVWARGMIDEGPELQSAGWSA